MKKLMTKGLRKIFRKAISLPKPVYLILLFAVFLDSLITWLSPKFQANPLLEQNLIFKLLYPYLGNFAVFSIIPGTLFVNAILIAGISLLCFSLKRNELILIALLIAIGNPIVGLTWHFPEEIGAIFGIIALATFASAFLLGSFFHSRRYPRISFRVPRSVKEDFEIFARQWAGSKKRLGEALEILIARHYQFQDLIEKAKKE